MYRHFTKSSPLPTYFTVPDRSLFIYIDTFCNAVDCRFELALEVRRWTIGPVANVCRGGQKLQLRHWTIALFVIQVLIVTPPGTSSNAGRLLQPTRPSSSRARPSSDPKTVTADLVIAIWRNPAKSTFSGFLRCLALLLTGWLGSRVVSVLDSGAERPGFKS